MGLPCELFTGDDYVDPCQGCIRVYYNINKLPPSFSATVVMDLRLHVYIRMLRI